MKVVIIPGDKAVYVDDKPIEIPNFDDLGVAPDVEAVVWDSGQKRGEVQFKRPAPLVLDEAMFNAMYIHAVAHHENRDMDLVAAETKRRLNDEAHTRRMEALAAERDRKSATQEERMAQLAADNEALKAAVAKLTAQQ